MNIDCGTSRHAFLLATLHVVGLLAVGCGESQQDLFLKHAQRDRGDATPDQSAAAPAQSAAAPAQPAAPDQPTADRQPEPATESVAKSPTPQADAAAKNEPSVETVSIQQEDKTPSEAPQAETQSLAETVGIPPISERKPESELSVTQRRQRAFENLQKINEAFLAYLQDKGRYPKAYRTNAGGVPTLSWRVELLPYLGHQDLYDRFDFSRAWNMSPNKELLPYIPDAYVSPERFDAKTNYLVPFDSAFMFGENRSLTPSMIDDGAENTIMLVEVNDQHAVNWTEPKDFSPKPPTKIAPYLGELRVDGSFALWASGFPVLLEKRLSDMQLFRAMTHAKNDGLQARDIHRAIAIEEAEADPERDQGASEAVAEADQQPEAAARLQMTAPPEELEVAREEVPSAVQLSEAREKLRDIYRQPLASADSPSQKARLAAKMVTTAADLQADPAGAYVLQAAAMRLAIEAGDASTLLSAIDQRVARFDVDSFEANLNGIQEFGEATASRDASTVDGKPILQRAIPVIYAGIADDQYMPASSVARIANRFTDQGRDDQLSRLLMRLRSQLGAAKREFEKSAASLEQYRSNPDDQAAGAAFGRFLCFIKGDWQRGLKLIAEGPSGDLVQVARMDLRGAQSPADQVAIGDAWWDLSERGNGIYKQGAQDRAVTWYRQAYERLPESLDRIHVKNRLQEADQTDGRSPIALCHQLADTLGVDLSQSLTTLAARGQRAARADDD